MLALLLILNLNYGHLDCWNVPFYASNWPVGYLECDCGCHGDVFSCKRAVNHLNFCMQDANNNNSNISNYYYYWLGELDGNSSIGLNEYILAGKGFIYWLFGDLHAVIIVWRFLLGLSVASRSSVFSMATLCTLLASGFHERRSEGFGTSFFFPHRWQHCCSLGLEAKGQVFLWAFFLYQAVVDPCVWCRQRTAWHSDRHVATLAEANHSAAAGGWPSRPGRRRPLPAATQWPGEASGRWQEVESLQWQARTQDPSRQPQETSAATSKEEPEEQPICQQSGADDRGAVVLRLPGAPSPPWGQAIPHRGSAGPGPERPGVPTAEPQELLGLQGGAGLLHHQTHHSRAANGWGFGTG